MADTQTTHLELVKQDANSRPNITKDHSNLDKLDSEIWARGKAFNGELVGEDGGFHIRKVPYAENLETSASQSSDEGFIIRSTGGQASLQDGDAWLTLLRGTRRHDNFTPESITMTVIPMARPVPATITAEINNATFIAYVEEAGTYTIEYDEDDGWDTSPATYGITVAGDPLDGDSISVVWDGENDPVMTVNAVPRVAPAVITATIDRDTFVAYVATSGTINLTYSTEWSANPALYGITVTGDPIAGDAIRVVYVKEVRGTIVQSNPQTFVSTGWNLYNHTNGYAKVIKYSNENGHGFKISGTYSTLEFATTISGGRVTITPVDGYFTLPQNAAEGYLFVGGGNDTDTAIWMTWSDWTSAANGGTFETYEETVINLATFMGEYFPYGLMQVGTYQDEINLNIGIATSYVTRMTYSAANLASAKASGKAYEYDENYIYIARDEPVSYLCSVVGDYTANDHGLEYFTTTEQEVYTQTLYGANLKNKLERDTVTISQQSLTDAQKSQVRTNIYAASKDEVKPITLTLEPVTSANGAYTNTVTDSRISEDMKPVAIEVGTPETFLAPITVETGYHTYTISCANAVGSSTVKVTFQRTSALDIAETVPYNVTSAEFDILAGRIGDKSTLKTTEKSSLVGAANELHDQIATTDSYDITPKTGFVLITNGFRPFRYIKYPDGKIRIDITLNHTNGEAIPSGTVIGEIPTSVAPGGTVTGSSYGTDGVNAGNGYFMRCSIGPDGKIYAQSTSRYLLGVYIEYYIR